MTDWLERKVEAEREWFQKEHEKQFGKSSKTTEELEERLHKAINKLRKLSRRKVCERKHFAPYINLPLPLETVSWTAPLALKCVCPTGDCRCSCKGNTLLPKKRLPFLIERGPEFCLSGCLKFFITNRTQEKNFTAVIQEMKESMVIADEGHETSEDVTQEKDKVAPKDLWIDRTCEQYYCSVSTQSETNYDGDFIIGDYSHILFGSPDESILCDIEGVELQVSSYKDVPKESRNYLNVKKTIDKLFHVTEIKQHISKVKKDMVTSIFQIPEIFQTKESQYDCADIKMETDIICESLADVRRKQREKECIRRLKQESLYEGVFDNNITESTPENFLNDTEQRTDLNDLSSTDDDIKNEILTQDPQIPFQYAPTNKYESNEINLTKSLSSNKNKLDDSTLDSKPNLCCVTKSQNSNNQKQSVASIIEESQNKINEILEDFRTENNIKDPTTAKKEDSVQDSDKDLKKNGKVENSYDNVFEQNLDVKSSKDTQESTSPIITTDTSFDNCNMETTPKQEMDSESIENDQNNMMNSTSESSQRSAEKLPSSASLRCWNKKLSSNLDVAKRISTNDAKQSQEKNEVLGQESKDMSEHSSNSSTKQCCRHRHTPCTDSTVEKNVNKDPSNTSNPILQRNTSKSSWKSLISWSGKQRVRCCKRRKEDLGVMGSSQNENAKGCFGDEVIDKDNETTSDFEAMSLKNLSSEVSKTTNDNAMVSSAVTENSDDEGNNTDKLDSICDQHYRFYY
ncbi:uncharacterized protein LOC110386606 isoform X3 [Bombyx mori]|uniref:uncharacterized protein LOC110386606 isoform X3 n=1 Tax=Bombyx mori TaxID=7091 RepID=UPI002ED4129B